MKKINNSIKRRLRNRKKLKKVSGNRYRVSIYKSLNNLSAQIIDDKLMKTLVSASSIEKDIKAKKIKKMDKSSFVGEILNLQIGFSHDINFKIPKEIKITVEKQTVIKINGVDKELVSKIAADIKNLKPVEPYKAKGIKEKGQFVLRKEGKKK